MRPNAFPNSAQAISVRQLAVLAAAFLVTCAATGWGDPLAGGILFIAPLIPFLMYAGLRGVSGDRDFGATLAVVLFFLAAANFRYREIAEKSIDFQVALKLFSLACIFGICALNIKTLFHGLYTRGFFYWTMLFVFMLITTMYSMGPQHAFVSVASMLGAFFYVGYLCVRLGRDRLVQVVVWLGFVLCTASLIVYATVPSLGRMKDWVGDELVVTSRLQGLFGTSNGAGCSAAIILFLTAVLHKPRSRPARFVWIGTLISAGLCLVLSNNRMAVASLVVTFGIYFILHGNVGRKVLFLFSVGLVAGSALVLFADEIFSLVSRSGSAEEITSATGRTRIWPVVIELWSQSPWLGWGFQSGQYILPKHPDLFEAAAHAHNLYLESLFSGGLIQLSLLIWCILTTLVLAIRVRALGEFALFSFYLMYGLTEPIFNGPIGVPVLLWICAVVLILHRAKALQPRRRWSADKIDEEPIELGSSKASS